MHSMPIYEYRCEDCDRRFELLTSFAERDRPQACPSCESTETRVLVSSFAALGGEFESTLPVAASGGGCCGGSCGCSHN
jgi:putative FmdB family regulatory protein